MLHSLLPKANYKFLSLPLLGPIADGYDDWLAANGFTRRSRQLSIRMLRIVDTNLRRHHIDEVAKLNHTVLDDCWKALLKVYPNSAGTVHTLEQYLVTSGLILHDRKVATQPSPLIEEYANNLLEVSGLAASTVSSHRRTAQCFLQHLEKTGTALGSIQASNIESYIAKAGKRLSRASLHHDISALRGFLRFVSTDGRAPTGLDRQIDTPRLYRME